MSTVIAVSSATSLADLIHNLAYSPAPESPEAAWAWLDGGNRTFGDFINGDFTEPGKTLFNAVNPATGAVLGHFTQSGPDEVNAAYEAAERAQKKWASLSPHRRARYLYALERMLMRHRRLFEVLEAMNKGKPFMREAKGDVTLSARHLGHHAALANNFRHLFPGREAGGVIGAIIAWNFPLMLLIWKFAGAIAAGNTIVIKPGDTTPVTAMLFAELCQKIKLPPGVVNIVTGDRETGKLMVAHPIPWKISFTGSTPAGQHIQQALAESPMKFTAELGGKSPVIVFPDTDLDSVVEATIRSILMNSGEVCCACSRLIVHQSVAPRLIEMLKRRFARIRVGDQLDKNTDMGPQNSKAQLDKILSMIELARENGATVWQPDCELPEEGYYTKPTILTNIGTDNPVAKEEVFGPVLAVFEFRTTVEAIELARRTEYGLAVSIFTNDIAKAHYVARQMKAGTVWINCVEQFDGASGFGGSRMSGFGREGGYEGIFDVTVDASGPMTGYVCEPTTEPLTGIDVVESDLREEPTPPPIHLHLVEVEDPDDVPLDATHRFLVNGELVRPDGEMCFAVRSPTGEYLGDVGDANRKDLRNAVIAAHKAKDSWADKGGDMRRKILMFMAERLRLNRIRLASEIVRQTGCTPREAFAEVDLAIERLFTWASWAVTYGGTVQTVAQTNMSCIATNGSIGVAGVRAPDESPLLGIVDLIGPLLAMGNSVVLISGKHALTAMTLVEIFGVKDVPPGVLNILTARNPDKLAISLAKHRAVNVIWCFGASDSAVLQVRTQAACNMKQVWAGPPTLLDWMRTGDPREALRHATEVTNTWTTFGA